jgi:hypothetical protein
MGGTEVDSPRHPGDPEDVGPPPTSILYAVIRGIQDRACPIIINDGQPRFLDRLCRIASSVEIDGESLCVEILPHGYYTILPIDATSTGVKFAGG